MQRVCPPVSNQLPFILKNLLPLGQETNFIKTMRKTDSVGLEIQNKKEINISPLGKDLPKNMIND